VKVSSTSSSDAASYDVKYKCVATSGPAFTPTITKTTTSTVTVIVSAANDCASTSFDNVDLDDVYGNHDSDFSVSIPTITNSAGSCGDQSISVKYSGASVSWA
jgi:hypothetical protein